MATELSTPLAPDQYDQFVTGQETTLAGERAWWRGLHALPEHDRERIVQVIKDDAPAYGRLGYRVKLDWSDEEDNADLFVRHPAKRKPTHSDVALLKGAMSATRARAGWGGSG